MVVASGSAAEGRRIAKKESAPRVVWNRPGGVGITWIGGPTMSSIHQKTRPSKSTRRKTRLPQQAQQEGLPPTPPGDSGAAPQDDAHDATPDGRQLWTHIARTSLGLGDIFPAMRHELHDLPLADLLLYGLSVTNSDDPVGDIIHSIGDSIELLAVPYRDPRGEEWPQPAEHEALLTIARKARVAAVLHARVVAAVHTHARRTGDE